ncbi:MAG: glycerophosphodiester phosphodiesterase family protein [Desulfotignum sp.]|jgi:glycerophosphoryl diester phosphodiesterase|nr:glycerophosphodiester phosphodiesterase family protein [Desulfotignum sp.]
MTEIIAHRGARSLAPENTLAAAKAAWQSGAHRWETDIQVTRDGFLVLFHDLDLLRCTNARKHFKHLTSEGRRKFLVSHFTLAELKALDAGSWFENTDPFSTIQKGYVTADALAGFCNEKIPTLEQGLLLTKNLDWQINLELKDHGTDPSPFYTVDNTLAAISESTIAPARVVVSSFNHAWLEQIRLLRPDIAVQALVGEAGTDIKNFQPGAFNVYNINAALVGADFVRNLVQQGFAVNLFTVNDPRTAAMHIQAGASGIITDFPQFFVNYITC